MPHNRILLEVSKTHLIGLLYFAYQKTLLVLVRGSEDVAAFFMMGPGQN